MKAYYEAFHMPVFSCDSGLYISDDRIYSAMDKDMESKPFIITTATHKIRRKGFPLDSISMDINAGKYFYDLPEEKMNQFAVEDGFLRFFREIY